MTDVRYALPNDAEDVEATLVDAFLADPMMAWMLEDPDRPGHARPDDLAKVMDVERRTYGPCGHSYTIPGKAAALWAPPGHRPDLTEFLEVFGALADPERVGGAGKKFMLIGEYEPEEPHFYLHMIGARDSARGQGLGSLLMDRVHAECDAERIPAYLEASTERSAALYERHGYERLATIEFAPSIALRPMLRPPQ
ncbi:MAG: GNAT family N-acetyltransferase [Acidimicrobiales bacterium]|jgi:GNAT superfamily N-acetyltransferase|nr:GNAT family N-acetyltransferase [Acidimicrobiales bacterium]